MKRLTSFICALFITTLINVNAQCVGSGVNSFLSNQNNTKAIKGAFSERYCTETINGKQYILLLMRVDKDCNLDFLDKYDHILCQRVGRIVTLKLNTKDLQKFIKEKDIIEIETSRPIKGETLRYATKDFGAKEVWEGKDLAGAYTGKDVIIGVADWGIDYTHPTFYDTTGTHYRILAAWDQWRKDGNAPEGFDYGTLLEGEEELISAGCDTNNMYDIGFHSTHVGGIAAGSGYNTIYKGVAWEANLIFCTWICDELHYMDACVWMRDYAKALGKRLVINNSWGVYNFGTMDGTSIIDEFINTMSEEDSVIFVVSAGNNGDSPFHVKADFNENPNDTLRTCIEFNYPRPYTEDYWGQAITMQSENSQIFSSKIEFYDYSWHKMGETPVLVSDGSTIPEDVFLTSNGDSIIYRASSRYPTYQKPIIDWEIRQSDSTTKYFMVLAITAEQGVVHAWNLNKLAKAVGNTGFAFKASQNGFLQGDNQYGVSEPSLSESCISVAAHQYRLTQWQAKIADFSSRGPNMTQYYKPEVSAPGYSIVSSVSSFSDKSPKPTETTTFNGKEYAFGTASGTSMSGPMVAGCVALILQANPNLSSQEIKDIIFQSTKTDKFTGECPNDTWGYGKINVYEAIKLAEKKVGLVSNEQGTINVFPNPAKDILYIEGLENNALIQVYDLNGKKLIEKNINGETLDVKSLTSGVYILNINNFDKTETLKFIKK